MSQFIAANIASAALVSSNPTNILIAGVSTSYSLSVQSEQHPDEPLHRHGSSTS